MLLAAGRAAVEVGAHAGNRGFGILALQLEVDVPVELVEAGVAADLGCARAEQPFHEGCECGLGHCGASSGEPREYPSVASCRAQLAPGVVQGLVQRAARRAEPIGENVDRHAVDGEGDRGRGADGARGRAR